MTSAGGISSSQPRNYSFFVQLCTCIACLCVVRRMLYAGWSNIKVPNTSNSTCTVISRSHHHTYSVTQKVATLKLFAICSFIVNLYLYVAYIPGNWKCSQLLPKHISTCPPIGPFIWIFVWIVSLFTSNTPQV